MSITEPIAGNRRADTAHDDPARYSRPQPDVPDYCTPTHFLVYDYATGATVLVPRSMYPELAR